MILSINELYSGSNTTTYDQIFHGFSFLLPHISVTLSTKAKTIFRGTFFVAISTNQDFVEITMTEGHHVSSSSV